MVLVTIHLKSAVHSSRDRLLGEARIMNTGDCQGDTCAYDYELSKFGGFSRGIWRRGTVTGHNRKARGPWDLLFRVLRDAVAKRNL